MKGKEKTLKGVKKVEGYNLENQYLRDQRSPKGITLVALVVTIIVLLILAGVTIMTLFSENGLINMAQKAKGETENAQANATAGIDSLINDMNSILNGNSGSDVPTVPDPATAGAATFNDGTTLSWEELKLVENGEKYGYDASKITDTSIGGNAFWSCDSITNITILDGVTSIDYGAFFWCGSLKSIIIPHSVTNLITDALQTDESSLTITYGGTIAEWNDILKEPASGGGIHELWNPSVIHVIHCTDGDTFYPPEAAAYPSDVIEAPDYCEFISIYDANALPLENQETFIAAQETLEEATPEGMTCSHFYYLLCSLDAVPDTPVSYTLDIGEFTDFVIKAYIGGAWVQQEATVNDDGTITIENASFGPVAIFKQD